MYQKKLTNAKFSWPVRSKLQNIWKLEFKIVDQKLNWPKLIFAGDYNLMKKPRQDSKYRSSCIR